MYPYISALSIATCIFTGLLPASGWAAPLQATEPSAATAPPVAATFASSLAVTSGLAAPDRLPVRGLVRPLHQAAISTNLAVRVARIKVREAERFKAGDVLIVFDCEQLEAEQAAADAFHREMKIGLTSNTYLSGKGAVGHHEVALSQARVDKAAAEARALKARLKQCRVTAPFDGRVAELAIHEQEVPAQGKPFITIIDERAFEIDLIVPSRWLRRLKTGTPFRFAVDELGESYAARVLRVGAAIDPVSQTVKVIAAFDKTPPRIRAGMSGAAIFNHEEAGQ